MATSPCGRSLAPLDYHQSVVGYLREREPDVWRWATERTSRADHLDALRTRLLRDTYRLEPAAHSAVYDALKLANYRLGIQAPAVLYQSAGQEMNAALIFVPGEIHIILQGPLLDRLAPEELLAVLGHELAHFLLWSAEGAQFLVADRILDDAIAVPNAAIGHRETYRRYALHTELFADRGGAIAAGAIEPAVSALVKIQTGIGTVDASAYLRQAEEIEANESGASEAYSHPEAFLRARALALWWGDSPDLGGWLERRLHGPLSLERLDLPSQLRMLSMSRGFLAHYLAGTDLKSEAVLAQLRSMFPDWREDEPIMGPDRFGPDFADDGVRSFLNALMLDMALIDADQQEEALVRAGLVAQELGSFDALLLNLKRDAGFGRREMERYKRRLAKEQRA